MDDKLYKEMDELQRYHWWYRGRRRIVQTLFKKYCCHAGGPATVLDAGCGTGEGARVIGGRYPIVGLDESAAALSLAKEKGYAELHEGHTEHMPFEDNRFRGILALDVLEHVGDDRAMLAECRRVLAPDGTLFLTVPAYMWLWSSHDVMFGHKRRYTKRELLKKLRDAGFEITFATYYCTILFLAGVVFNQVFRKYIHKKVENFFSMPKVFNSLLYFLFLLEVPFFWLGLPAPFGSSIIIVAGKS